MAIHHTLRQALQVLKEAANDAARLDPTVDGMSFPHAIPSRLTWTSILESLSLPIPGLSAKHNQEEQYHVMGSSVQRVTSHVMSPPDSACDDGVGRVHGPAPRRVPFPSRGLLPSAAALDETAYALRA